MTPEASRRAVEPAWASLTRPVERGTLRHAYLHPAGHASGAVLHTMVEACLVSAGVCLTDTPEAADVAVAPLLRRFLPDTERNAPRLGTLVFHPSLLPRRRGPDAMRWAVLSGDAFTGATWFWAAGGYDDGDIAEQELVPIPPGLRPGEVYRELVVPAAVRAFVRLLEQLRAGVVRRVPQDPDAATYEGKWPGPSPAPSAPACQGPDHAACQGPCQGPSHALDLPLERYRAAAAALYPPRPTEEACRAAWLDRKGPTDAQGGLATPRSPLPAAPEPAAVPATPPERVVGVLPGLPGYYLR